MDDSLVEILVSYIFLVSGVFLFYFLILSFFGGKRVFFFFINSNLSSKIKPLKYFADFCITSVDFFKTNKNQSKCYVYSKCNYPPSIPFKRVRGWGQKMVMSSSSIPGLPSLDIQSWEFII